jgi:rhodanese-related sulfurtransferase
MRNKAILILYAMLGLSCFPLPAQRGEFTAEEFNQMATQMASDMITTISIDDMLALKDPVLLDAREPKEYKVSHLGNADLIGYDNFDLGRVIDNYDVNDTIIVYCSVGYRSGKIGEQLQRAGYRHVYNLDGGLFRWVNQGKPIVNQEDLPTSTVHGFNKKWSKWLYKRVEVVY